MLKNANGFKLTLALISIMILFSACAEKTKQEDLARDMNVTDVEMEDNKIVIYQMMVRLFGNTKTANVPWGTMEENGVGKFNDIDDKALQELKKMGVTHVWYTGVLEHATMSDFTEYGIEMDDADVVKGRAGSPYAIKDYYDVNPYLAESVPNRMAEFEALVKRTHQNGLKLFIDFVPNHVARKYISDVKPEGVEDFGATDDTSKAFDPNNNYYYIPGEPFVVPEGNDPLGPDSTHPTEDGQFDENPAKVTGNDQFTAAPHVNTWFETVKLNYGVDVQNKRKTYFDPIPDTWYKMKDILTYWAEKGVDGFRCDMAEMVPVEFWGWVIPQIKKVNPDIIFMAEIYNKYAYQNYIDKGKFDYLYDKVGMYDSLKSLIKGRGNAKEIQYTWMQSTVKEITPQLVRFLENHDEMRIASKGFAGDPFRALPAMVVSATMHSGPVMIYFGQEIGEKAEGAEGFGGDDNRTTIFDYWGVPGFQNWVNGKQYDGGKLSEDQKKLRSFYTELLNFVHKHPAVKQGKLYDLYFANADGQSAGFDTKKHLAYIRTCGSETLLFIFNLDQENAMDAVIKLPEAGLNLIGAGVGDTVTFERIFGAEKENLEIDTKKASKRTLVNAGFPMQLGPNEYVIYQMK